MKTWTELQEWVETNGRSWGIDVANHVKEGMELTEAVKTVIEDLRGRGGGDVTLGIGLPHSREYELIYAALAWKGSELVAERYTKLATGWAEAYLADLHRMYEEES